MANEYVELEELKATLELSGEGFADDDLRLMLTAASRGIDGATGRRFWEDADAAQQRVYTPVSADWLQIDDLIELTSLKTDTDGNGTFENTWTLNTDFVLEPLNAAADARPWTSVSRHPRGSYRELPVDLPRSVQVTGKFGWDAVPEGIKAATSIVATKLVRRAREAPFGIVSIGIDGAAVRIARTDPDVRFLISDYTRNSFGLA